MVEDEGVAIVIDSVLKTLSTFQQSETINRASEKAVEKLRRKFNSFFLHFSFDSCIYGSCLNPNFGAPKILLSVNNFPTHY